MNDKIVEMIQVCSVYYISVNGMIVFSYSDYDTAMTMCNKIVKGIK